MASITLVRLIDLHDNIFEYFTEWAMARSLSDESKLKSANQVLCEQARDALEPVGSIEAVQLLEDITTCCQIPTLPVEDPKGEASKLGELRERAANLARGAA